MRESLYLKLSIWSTSILPSLCQGFKGPEKETMNFERAGNFSFFLSPLVRSTYWEGQVCIPGVQIYFVFHRHLPNAEHPRYFEGELHPTFVFFSPSQFDLRTSHGVFWAFLFLPSLPELSLWRYLSDFHIFL